MQALHIDEIHEREEEMWGYVDDTTGQLLDPEDVRKARQLEMKIFKDMDVYGYLKRDVAVKDREGKLVGVRWVDVQKGEEVRSRLVAQEYAAGSVRDDLFAGTPPSVAMRYILSEIASSGTWGPGRRRAMVIDVKRAFLYGAIEENLYIELPEEDEKRKQGFVGKLRKAMYGTRAAPQIWQKVVRSEMSKMGFQMSKKFPCVYFNKARNLKVMTYVDDFLCSGPDKELKWFLEAIGKTFEVKSEMLGPGKEEKSEVKFLGRALRWRREGLEYEADEKHVEVLLREWGMCDSKAVCTPGTAEEKKTEGEAGGDIKLTKLKAKEFRRAAARINYLDQDRADLSFTAKEISCAMAEPTEADVMRLKRCLRYLKGATQGIHKIPMAR